MFCFAQIKMTNILKLKKNDVTVNCESGSWSGIWVFFYSFSRFSNVLLLNAIQIIYFEEKSTSAGCEDLYLSVLHSKRKLNDLRIQGAQYIMILS